VVERRLMEDGRVDEGGAGATKSRSATGWIRM
jgi:hypothetical protein